MSIIDLTQETNGGGPGGDVHNLGWYSTPEALKEAHPTASNGDFAIVGTTDSVWVWDSDTSNWLDTKSSGLVESVNGKTGKVVLKTSDLENDSGYITKDIDNLTNYLTSTEVNTLLDGKININEKGTPDGVATLGADSKIPLNQLKVIDDTTVAETTTYSSKKIDETFAKTTGIPTKVSELENDSKYITKEVNDLTYYSTAAEVNDLLQTKISLTEKGIANGVATLGADSKIPLNQLKVIDDVSATETTTYSSKKIDTELAKIVSNETKVYDSFNIVKNDPIEISDNGIASNFQMPHTTAIRTDKVIDTTNATSMHIEYQFTITKLPTTAGQLFLINYGDSSINGKPALQIHNPQDTLIPDIRLETIVYRQLKENVTYKAIIECNDPDTCVLTLYENNVEVITGQTSIEWKQSNYMWLGALYSGNAEVKVDLKACRISIDNIEVFNGTLLGTKQIQELLNTKADDTAVVHKTGAETIEGVKTFKNDVTAASLSLTNEIFTIAKGNQAIIRNTTTGETVISNTNGSTNGLCLRPNGTDESEGQVIINKDGTINGIVTKAQADADGNTISTTYAKADAVVHLTGNESIAGTKTFTDNAKIGSTEKTANLDIIGNLNIQGNIVQNGQAYETHAEKVYTTNDYIILRDGAEAGLAVGEYSGLEYIKYDGTNNGRLVIDNTGTARVGDINDEQPLLTRDEKANLSNGTVLIWDDTTNKAIKASKKGSNTLPVYVNVEGNLEPIESYEGNSATSTKAEQDSEGQQITSTYIKEIAITGTDLTYTKGDGTATTITTQDNQVESIVSATNVNYPILLNNGTGATTSKANIDIEMYANPSTNTIGASTFKVGNKVNISVNTYTNALDFNWI